MTNYFSFLFLPLSISAQVLQSSVGITQPLILYSEVMTNSSRVKSVPQIEVLVNGEKKTAKNILDSIECFQISQGKWKCTTNSFKDDYSIISSDIQCEGYSYKGDSRILEQSCGVILDLKDSRSFNNVFFSILYFLRYVILAIFYPTMFSICMIFSILENNRGRGGFGRGRGFGRSRSSR